MNKPWSTEYKVDAHISDCEKYRYWLEIIWDEKTPRMGLIMLNPSKADHRISDPTALRAIAFAKREGFGGVVIANLYAYRATNPKDLPLGLPEAEGPANLPTLGAMPDRCAKLVVAWGATEHGSAPRRAFLDRMKFVELWCLGVTKFGEPRHPLYLKSDAPLVRYR